MSVIICLTGDIGSGKTEFTNILHKIEPFSASFESRQVISEAANEFNANLKVSDINSLAIDDVNNALEQTAIWMNRHFQSEINVQSITYSNQECIDHPELFMRWHEYWENLKQNPGLIYTEINETNKGVFRPLLQWLGGYFAFKYKPSIWFDEINRRILKLSPRPKLITINALRYPEQEQAMRGFAGLNDFDLFVVGIERQGTDKVNDVTENSRVQIKLDTKIINDGSLSDLVDKAGKLLTDIERQKLQPVY